MLGASPTVPATGGHARDSGPQALPEQSVVVRAPARSRHCTGHWTGHTHTRGNRSPPGVMPRPRTLETVTEGSESRRDASHVAECGKGSGLRTHTNKPELRAVGGRGGTRQNVHAVEMCVVSPQGDVGPAGPPGLPGSVVSGPARGGWNHGVRGWYSRAVGERPSPRTRQSSSDDTRWYKAFSSENGGRSETSQTLLHCRVHNLRGAES